ncbi:hypothetical protein HO133_007140 [Letharia lupina]|uniref:PQ loop repeat protein n=1 Tax=Letharia lupina TaxID=560253 RepID=A0A8H6FIA7_9LECA|nr:uncharacterized protein HO133_007140 [Letharia lupina]KAF6229026.1 hypothetical protein HO133_007140 [Letharia lupina]
MGSYEIDQPVSGACVDLSSPNIFNFILSILILLGILVSYLPQHHRIISRRSSTGISPYFVLLGTTSGTCAFANILTLPASRRDLACCRELSGFECVAGALGIAQVGVQWSCFMVILFLFLLFFPRTPSDAKSKDEPTYRLAITVFLTSIVHLVLTFLVSVIIIYLYRSRLASWAHFLGIFGTCLAAIQFLPQIWTTWKLQEMGSLSIPMMCIQTPGSFVWVGSLAARFGWEGWSTWGIYLVTGVLQGCLLVMGITFELRARKKGKAGLGGVAGDSNEHANQMNGNGHGYADGDEDHERTGLLGNER